MKRLTAFVLTFALVLCCAACAPKDETLTKPAAFYYCHAEVPYDGRTGLIVAEQREAARFGDDIAALLNAYLQGPTGEEFLSPFPAGIRVVSFNTSPTVITVVLSQEFSQLTGLDLIIACVCLSRTVFDIAPQNRVQIAAYDSTLDGQAYIVLDRDSVLLADDPADITPTEETAAP